MLIRRPLVIDRQRPRRHRHHRIAYYITEALVGLVLIGAILGGVMIIEETIKWLMTLQ